MPASISTCFLAALVFATTPLGFAQEHWVATWAASPQETRIATAAPALAQGPPGQAGAPAQPPPAPPITNFQNQTVRMVLRTSIGGRRARVELSNVFGTKPLTIGAAHIALAGKESAILPDSDHPLTFGGKPSFTIPAGAQAISDVVDFTVPEMANLAISLYLPGETGMPTTHSTALHTTYISDKGDLTSAVSMQDAKTSRSWYWISGVDVVAPPETGLIVAFGDSITDGTTSTVDADRSWPAILAERFLSNPRIPRFAVVNEGISGNRLLHDVAGANALARFDRDVLSQPGVKWITVLEGINDIGRATQKNAQAADAVTAAEIIGALRQIIERAHIRGIRVLGCTLTPFEGAFYYSDAGEAMRQQVNDWIRTGGAFDAFIDFDALMRDPNNPQQIRPEFNIRDHLHPNDAGYKAMAQAFDLAIFSLNRPILSAGR